MMMLSGLAVILTNLLVLALLFGIWRFIRSRGPMTAAKLRRTISWCDTAPSDVLPCGGELGATAALLRALEAGGTERDLIRALFVRWAQQKAIFVGRAPKKKLRSFGADLQAELSIPEEMPVMDGAQQLLYGTICEWVAPEDGTLQQSELYQAARQDAERVDNRLRQLIQEGNRALREMGGATPERKKVAPGMEEQEIYTAKGVRLARQCVAYVKFTQQAPSLRGEAAVLAAAMGRIDPEDPVCVLADALFDGLQAGLQASR